MISLKNFFRIGFSAFAIVCLLNETSCTSGSKDTMPVENDNSSATTSTSDSSSETIVPNPQADSATTAKTETTESDNEKASVHVVTIENMKFNPATISINKGDQVTFINKDIVGHNATEVNNLGIAHVTDWPIMDFYTRENVRLLLYGTSGHERQNYCKIKLAYRLNQSTKTIILYIEKTNSLKSWFFMIESD